MKKHYLGQFGPKRTKNSCFKHPRQKFRILASWDKKCPKKGFSFFGGGQSVKFMRGWLLTLMGDPLPPLAMYDLTGDGNIGGMGAWGYPTSFDFFLPLPHSLDLSLRGKKSTRTGRNGSFKPESGRFGIILRSIGKSIQTPWNGHCWFKNGHFVLTSANFDWGRALKVSIF